MRALPLSAPWSAMPPASVLALATVLAVAVAWAQEQTMPSLADPVDGAAFGRAINDQAGASWRPVDPEGQSWRLETAPEPRRSDPRYRAPRFSLPDRNDFSQDVWRGRL
ncbi:MAG: hypothetical protein AAFR52_18560 [Pseudomonadota bacterium]